MKNISSANKGGLNSSVPIWIPFVSFSYLIVLATIFSTTLNGSGPTYSGGKGDRITSAQEFEAAVSHNHTSAFQAG